MGNASSSEEGAGGLGHPNLLTKISIRGTNKSDVDAFLTEGRVDNVAIAYITKKQVSLMVRSTHDGHSHDVDFIGRVVVHVVSRLSSMKR